MRKESVKNKSWLERYFADVDMGATIAIATVMVISLLLVYLFTL